MRTFRSPRVMGIINCTPDSFYPGSRAGDADAGMQAARRMIAEGADILDVGGESTRPGSRAIGAEEQIARVVPVIRGIRKESDVSISVDTRIAAVAEAALDAGADIINDISSLNGDAGMAALAAERDVPVILMHMQGTPENMQDNPRYDDVVTEVRAELIRAAQTAQEKGIRKANIILDPGIGFGKRPQDNAALLSRMEEWRADEYPLLIGLSRKSFLGLILEAERAERVDMGLSSSARPAHHDSTGPEERLIATLAAHAWCLNHGADILRVHDVKETRQLIAVWEALAWAS